MKMDAEIEKSLNDVLKALQDLTLVYDRRVDELRMKGLEREKLDPIVEGSAAMKDSAAIFLSWAKHYVEKISHPTGEKQAEAFYSET